MFQILVNEANRRKKKVLEEYIDCLFMILYFCNITGVSLEEDFPIRNNKDDVIKTFLNLYELGANLDKIPNKEQMKKLLIEILYLAKLFDFTLDDLEKETKIKSEIIQKILNSDY